MFFSSQSIKASFIFTSIATSSIVKPRANAGAHYAPLELPVNVTSGISAINDNIPANSDTVLPDSAFLDDGIAWPDSSAPPNLSAKSASASPSPSPSPGAPKYACNGKAYGKNLNIPSCLQAWEKFPMLKNVITFGERKHGNWDASLPFRILSSDGLCAFDISHKAGIFSDRARPNDLRQSARALIDICVKGSPNVGGVVSNLGENGNLAVRITPYRPRVSCADPESGISPLPSDCRVIIDEMPVDGTRRIFGNKNDSDPEIDVKLPYGFQTGLRRCQFFVDTLLPGIGKDASDFYKLCMSNALPPAFNSTSDTISVFSPYITRMRVKSPSALFNCQH